MRWLVSLLLLGALVLGAAEVLVPWRAEAAVERRATRSFPQAADVDADVGDFPVVPGLLGAPPTVARVEVAVASPATGTVPIEELTLVLREVALDREDLLDGEVTVTGLGGGRASARVGLDRLIEEVGAPVGLDQVDAEALEVVDGYIEGELPGAGPARIRIPDDVLPCDQQAVIRGRALLVRCDLDRVPAWLT